MKVKRMANNGIKYDELARAKIQPKRSLVISAFSKGGFTIGQQLEVEEGNKKTNVNLKGAFHIDDLDGLYNLRDALNVAIQRCEQKNP